MIQIISGEVGLTFLDTQDEKRRTNGMNWWGGDAFGNSAVALGSGRQHLQLEAGCRRWDRGGGSEGAWAARVQAKWRMGGV